VKMGEEDQDKPPNGELGCGMGSGGRSGHSHIQSIPYGKKRADSWGIRTGQGGKPNESRLLQNLVRK